jgi:hypothetical protein
MKTIKEKHNIATKICNINTLKKYCVITWSTQHNIEVKTIDSNAGVILDTQVNVLLDAKSKVATVRKIVFPQFILPDLRYIKKI